MAMTALTVQPLASHSLEPVYTAANADGHKFYNDGHTLLHVKNTNAAPVTVTIATPGTVDGLAIADWTVSVDATTGDTMIGLLPPAVYNQTGTDAGMVYVTFSAVTNVTVAAVQL